MQTITSALPCPVPLNESPSEKEGKLPCLESKPHWLTTLNESPSEKEGKFLARCEHHATSRFDPQ